MNLFPIPGPKPFSRNQTERRRTHETAVVLSMLEMFCRAEKHENRQMTLLDFPLPISGDEKCLRALRRKEYVLCPSCRKKAVQLIRQIQRCPHMAYKTFCHECPKPCHPPDPFVSEMMRYSGPRLLLFHPLLAIRHLRYLLHRRYVLRHHRRRKYEIS